MALQMSYTAPDGTTYPACYCPISYVLAYPETATLVVSYYADKASFEAGADALKVGNYDAATAQLDGAIFANGYTYLLTLPDFAGAAIVP